MTITHPPLAPTRRGAGVAITLLLHALLVIGWHHARKAPPPELSGPREEIQWVTIQPVKPAPPPLSTPLPTPPPRPAPKSATPRAAEAAASAASRPAAAAAAPPPAAPLEQAKAAELLPATPSAPSTPVPMSAYELLQQAKRGIGKIDQDLRKAYPAQPITAPVRNGATRLAQGLQDAADAAPNKWYQAPKITEITDPGPYGRRRYRVIYPHATYCITVESNHAPDGIDQMQKGIQQKTTTCDEDEQKPTVQKYK